MRDEVISYPEMCQREGCGLQRGMYFRLQPDHSVVLMCVRPDAPYADRVLEDGRTVIYEGHDQRRSAACPNPKSVDQPATSESGKPTQNGLFFAAAQCAKAGDSPERVRVYEKLHQGVWAFTGVFLLVDAYKEPQAGREVFKFRLQLCEDGLEPTAPTAAGTLSRGRLIPTAIKVEVWRRDRGRCVVCGATDELHFDHILPVAKGGTSVTADNVQILCARHNLEKSARIV
jgi:hypothetical protein